MSLHVQCIDPSHAFFQLFAKERRKEYKKLTKGLTNNKDPGFDESLFSQAEYYFENGQLIIVTLYHCTCIQMFVNIHVKGKLLKKDMTWIR